MTVCNAVRIKTDPDPMEPYRLSQGFKIGDLIYLSGQASIDLQGNLVGEGDFDAQADQTFRNLEATLAIAGSSLAQVVKVTIYLTDMDNFPKIIELREKWFTQPWPADTLVQVQSLALPELMIEIEAVAMVEGQTVEA